MTSTASLLTKKRFLPLFITQFLNAFNDNFFKMAMVILVTYKLLDDASVEAQFNALVGATLMLPFFLFSALAGQLADKKDKSKIIRIVKNAEIVIMLVGAFGIYIENIYVMMIAFFALGTQSAFLGPIKYAILPQHLNDDEVLGGTGLVEAGTYIAILAGTILGGILPAQWSAIGIIIFSLIGRWSAQYIPSAAPEPGHEDIKIDYNIFRNSWRLLSRTMNISQLALAIWSISFFWAIAAVFGAIFPPMVKNSLTSDNTVATLFTAIFSVGIAIGSIAINKLLKGKVSARFSMASVVVMGFFIIHLWWAVNQWTPFTNGLLDWRAFLSADYAKILIFDILCIAIAGGMFVVPLYAFLTTKVAKSQTARTIAANNIVNSGAMVLGTIIFLVIVGFGISVVNSLFMLVAICLISAWMAHRLDKAPDPSEIAEQAMDKDKS